MKSLINFVLKFAIAGVLIFFLIRNGKMDFSLLAKSLDNPLNWGITLGLFLCIILVASFRWRGLLHVKSQVIFPFTSILRLTWIGLLFNTVLPGAVSGDLVKLIYARDIDSSISKTFLITSVLLDRVFGLFGLILVLGFFTLISYSELSLISPEVKGVMHLNLLLLLGILVFLLCIFIPKSKQKFFYDLIEKIPLVHKPIIKVLTAVWDVGEKKSVVFKSIGLSMICHVLAISAFYNVASPFFDIPIPLQHVFTFVPIGLISIAIPITPAGLGIGHHVFGKLFSFFGVHNGVSLFNFFFICQVFINTLGIIPYLFGGKRHSLDEVNQLEEAI